MSHEADDPNERTEPPGADPGPDSLTEEERDAFAALPRERVPPAPLEERVVGALREEGLLGVRRRAATGWWAAASTAAVALFAGGTVTGQWMAARSTERMVATVLDGGAAARALRVQEAGSAYVRAVARLADLAEGEETGAVDPGVEAAHAALRAAALEIGRLRPDDPTIALVIGILEEARAATTARPEGTRTTIWF